MHASSGVLASCARYIQVYVHMYTRPRGGGGGPEGLILSSVMVEGQRHLCATSKLTWPNKPYIKLHLLTSPAFAGRPFRVIKTSAGSRRGTKRRETSRGRSALVVARNEHSSLNVSSFSAETVSRVSFSLLRSPRRPGITSGIYEPFILKMVAGETGPEASRDEEL